MPSAELRILLAMTLGVLIILIVVGVALSIFWSKASRRMTQHQQRTNKLAHDLEQLATIAAQFPPDSPAPFAPHVQTLYARISAAQQEVEILQNDLRAVQVHFPDPAARMRRRIVSKFNPLPYVRARRGLTSLPSLRAQVKQRIDEGYQTIALLYEIPADTKMLYEQRTNELEDAKNTWSTVFTHAEHPKKAPLKRSLDDLASSLAVVKKIIDALPPEIFSRQDPIILQRQDLEAVTKADALLISVQSQAQTVYRDIKAHHTILTSRNAELGALQPARARTEASIAVAKSHNLSVEELESQLTRSAGNINTLLTEATNNDATQWQNQTAQAQTIQRELADIQNTADRLSAQHAGLKRSIEKSQDAHAHLSRRLTSATEEHLYPIRWSDQRMAQLKQIEARLSSLASAMRQPDPTQLDTYERQARQIEHDLEACNRDVERILQERTRLRERLQDQRLSLAIPALLTIGITTLNQLRDINLKRISPAINIEQLNEELSRCMESRQQIIHGQSTTLIDEGDISKACGSIDTLFARMDALEQRFQQANASVKALQDQDRKHQQALREKLNALEEVILSPAWSAPVPLTQILDRLKSQHQTGKQLLASLDAPAAEMSNQHADAMTTWKTTVDSELDAMERALSDSIAEIHDWIRKLDDDLRAQRSTRTPAADELRKARVLLNDYKERGPRATRLSQILQLRRHLTHVDQLRDVTALENRMRLWQHATTSSFTQGLSYEMGKEIQRRGELISQALRECENLFAQSAPLTDQLRRLMVDACDHAYRPLIVGEQYLIFSIAPDTQHCEILDLQLRESSRR